ncbi:Myosin light chain kinase, smooth muscle [Dufourea novaeangliae]|uniref:Myosin light chain kinase, smooth muscle n=1 Tax=Dufourea novaeangliae TaxID=178035 RepID=A0A154PSB4_DUFNO|nr:Myosin light chain kinase, smooth muscle [Dufourea novaeangliae]
MKSAPETSHASSTSDFTKQGLLPNRKIPPTNKAYLGVLATGSASANAYAGASAFSGANTFAGQYSGGETGHDGHKGIRSYDNTGYVNDNRGEGAHDDSSGHPGTGNKGDQGNGCSKCKWEDDDYWEREEDETEPEEENEDDCDDGDDGQYRPEHAQGHRHHGHGSKSGTPAGVQKLGAPGSGQVPKTGFGNVNGGDKTPGIGGYGSNQHPNQQPGSGWNSGVGTTPKPLWNQGKGGSAPGSFGAGPQPGNQPGAGWQNRPATGSGCSGNNQPGSSCGQGPSGVGPVKQAPVPFGIPKQPGPVGYSTSPTGGYNPLGSPSGCSPGPYGNCGTKPNEQSGPHGIPISPSYGPIAGDTGKGSPPSNPGSGPHGPGSTPGKPNSNAGSNKPGPNRPKPHGGDSQIFYINVNPAPGSPVGVKPHATTKPAYQPDPYNGQGPTKNPYQPGPYGDTATTKPAYQPDPYNGQGPTKNPYQPGPYGDTATTKPAYQPDPYNGQGPTKNPYQPGPYGDTATTKPAYQPDPYNGQATTKPAYQPDPYNGQRPTKNPYQPGPYGDTATTKPAYQPDPYNGQGPTKNPYQPGPYGGSDTTKPAYQPGPYNGQKPTKNPYQPGPYGDTATTKPAYQPDPYNGQEPTKNPYQPGPYGGSFPNGNGAGPTLNGAAPGSGNGNGCGGPGQSGSPGYKPCSQPGLPNVDKVPGPIGGVRPIDASQGPQGSFPSGNGAGPSLNGAAPGRGNSGTGCLYGRCLSGSLPTPTFVDKTVAGSYAWNPSLNGQAPAPVGGHSTVTDKPTGIGNPFIGGAQVPAVVAGATAVSGAGTWLGGNTGSGFPSASSNHGVPPGADATKPIGNNNPFFGTGGSVGQSPETHGIHGQSPVGNHPTGIDSPIGGLKPPGVYEDRYSGPSSGPHENQHQNPLAGNRGTGSGGGVGVGDGSENFPGMDVPGPFGGAFSGAFSSSQASSYPNSGAASHTGAGGPHSGLGLANSGSWASSGAGSHAGSGAWSSSSASAYASSNAGSWSGSGAHPIKG